MNNQNSILEQIKEQLSANEDVVYQHFLIHGHSCALIYIESIINIPILQDQVSKVFIEQAGKADNWESLAARLDQGTLFPLPYVPAATLEEAIDQLVQGKALFCFNDARKIYLFDLAKYEKRAVSESKTNWWSLAHKRPLSRT